MVHLSTGSYSKWKRYTVIFGIGALYLLITNLCFAMTRLPSDDYALGGLQVGETADHVQSIYGVPDWIEQYREGTPGTDDIPIFIYHYGDTFEVSIGIMSSGNLVEAIRTTANNGIATPRGIHVGSNIADVRNAYGDLLQESDTDDGYSFSNGFGYDMLVIHADKNGRVDEIATGDLDALD